MLFSLGVHSAFFELHPHFSLIPAIKLAGRPTRH